jgi:hypothetical protein
MVIVVAEGAGQDLIPQDICSKDFKDASANKLLLYVAFSKDQGNKTHGN